MKQMFGVIFAAAFVAATLPMRASGAPPVIVRLIGSSPGDMPSPEGTTVAVIGEFYDASVLGTHIADVNWDDDTVTPAFVEETDGAGSFMASHSYAAGGVYDVVVVVHNDALSSASAATFAFITGVGLHRGILQIVGDATPNVITLNRESTRVLDVRADFLGEGRLRRFDLTSIEHVEVYACPDDQVNVAGNMNDVDILILPCSE